MIGQGILDQLPHTEITVSKRKIESAAVVSFFFSSKVNAGKQESVNTEGVNFGGKLVKATNKSAIMLSTHVASQWIVPAL
jgi:hypothetical protein